MSDYMDGFEWGEPPVPDKEVTNKGNKEQGQRPANPKGMQGQRPQRPPRQREVQGQRPQQAPPQRSVQGQRPPQQMQPPTTEQQNVNWQGQKPNKYDQRVAQGGGNRNTAPNQAPQQPRQRKPRPQQAQAPQPQYQQSFSDTQGFADDTMVPMQGKPKKKGGIGKVILILVVLGMLACGGIVAFKYYTANNTLSTVDYTGSGKETLDRFATQLTNYEPSAIDALVGTEEGDSYIAQEWSYANKNEFIEQFIIVATDVIAFEYPEEQVLTLSGKPALDKEGKPVMQQALMNNGEAVTVTIPDYEKLSTTMEEDKEYILKLFASSGYSKKDYLWEEEMTNLMLQWILDRGALPTKQVSMVLPVSGGVVTDDGILDDALFSSDSFHKMCDNFAKVCLKWTGREMQTYTEEEIIKNPKHAEWLKAYESGKYKTKDVKELDGNGDPILDADGNAKIETRIVIKEGKEWKEPSEGTKKKVEKEKEVDVEWTPEYVIPYNWCGAYYLQNVYDGANSTVVKIGDGTKSKPAGVGTEVVTKVKCTNGLYADVKVAVTGYWKEADAITYAEGISTKNKGLTTDSVLRFIVYEVSVENLMPNSITFNSEMTLCDDNANLASRTGTFYGFTGTVTLESGQRTVLNDWGSSTELPQKFVCWGKTFERKYPMVYFNILAGTGEVPSYSAYEQFTGANTEGTKTEESEQETEQ